MFHDLEKSCSESTSQQQLSKEGYIGLIEPNLSHPVLLSVALDTSAVVYKPSPNLRVILKNGPIENGVALQQVIVNSKNRGKVKKEQELTEQDLICSTIKVIEELYPQ